MPSQSGRDNQVGSNPKGKCETASIAFVANASSNDYIEGDSNPWRVQTRRKGKSSTNRAYKKLQSLILPMQLKEPIKVDPNEGNASPLIRINDDDPIAGLRTEVLLPFESHKTKGYTETNSHVWYG